MSDDVDTCVCGGNGDPKPRFCRDDLFCPQCGGAVAWIDSDHFLIDPADPGREALWVYATGPEDAPVYALALRLLELGPSGPRERDLELRAEGCRLEAPGFEREVEVVARGTRAELRFKPSPPNGQLPHDGARGRLTLDGNCGARGKVVAGRRDRSGKLDVILYNKPNYAVIVEGAGDKVERRPDDRDTWLLWKTGPQKLTVKIRPTDAWVYLPEAGAGPSWPLGEGPPVPTKVEEVPRVREIYAPLPARGGPAADRGEPATVVLAVDSSAWEPEEAQKLLLGLDFALGQTLSRTLSLIRQAEEMLVWSTGNEVKVGAMFYGEVAETPSATPGPLPAIAVSNTGETPWMVRPPEIVGRPPWIAAAWADGEEGLVSIQKGREPRKLRIRVDLSALDSGNHAPGTPLKAEVVVQHSESGMRAALGLTIEWVGVRPAMKAPLALDFGNTNSYASADGPRRGSDDAGGARSVLSRAADPETFASVLAFHDVEDAEKPEYEIGDEALEIGRRHPPRLERGLKRALTGLRPVPDGRGGLVPVEDARHPFNAPSFVYHRTGSDPARYSLRQLLRFYVLAAIDRCETAERATVVDLGLSYPANFGAEPRRALDLVVKDVEAECKRRRPESASKIAFRPLGPDEASAVALGFVLDPATRDEHVLPLFQEGRARFTVASFDFGGGSIDVALIRFELAGRPPLTNYASSLLGLGGDERFGGDNVTAAVYEILADRLGAELARLSPAEELRLAPLNALRQDVVPDAWTNQRALWDAAEATKRAACRGAPDAARAEVSEALKALQDLSPTSLAALARLLESGRLDVEPSEIYDHAVRCDLAGTTRSYTARERLEAAAKTLRTFVDRAGEDASPRFLILAGASCRVPLARELLAAEFPEAVILPGEGTPLESYRPKSKVADGLARFLQATRGGGSARVRGLKSARAFTHADVLWIGRESPDLPVVWVPSCVEIAGDRWRALETDEDPPRTITLGDACCRFDPRVIEIHRRAFPEPELIGSATLDRVADLVEPGVESRPPASEADLDAAEVLLRFDGEEDRLRIRLRLGDVEYGDWRVVPPHPS